MPFFAALQGFEDLSGRVEDIGGDAAYPEGVWTTTQMAGQDGIWAVPWFTEARAIYYRKDALEKAGVDRGGRVRRLGRDDRDAAGDQGQGAGAASSAVRLTRQEGLRPRPSRHAVRVGRGRGRAERGQHASPTINSPEAAEGLAYFGDLLQKGLYDKSQLQRDGTQVETQFKGGRIAVWIGGPWTLRVDLPYRRRELGRRPLARTSASRRCPTAPGGDEGFTFVGGSNLMMFKSAKNKDAAWELMKFMSTDDFQTKYAELLGMFPSRSEPQQAIAAKDPGYESWYDAIQQGRTYAPIPQWAQIENAYKAHFGNILDAAGGIGGDSFNAETVNAAARGRGRGGRRAARAERGRLIPPAVSSPPLMLAAAGRAGSGAAAAGPPAQARAAGGGAATRSPTR